MRTALHHAVLVGSGGMIGAAFRYGLAGLVQARFPLATFPFGTLAVNLLGCLSIGVLAGLMESRQLFSPEFRAFALIGLLGGFTTYSSFAYETLALLRDGEHLRAFVNVTVHVLAGLALVWTGYALAAVRWIRP